MHTKTKTWLVGVVLVGLAALFGPGNTGCDSPPDSDQIQQQSQETILQEITARTGMPAIPNAREKKLLKAILEMRDMSLVTYTYFENAMPVVSKGHTALGGKLTFFGDTLGYGIPYATQYTSPQKVTRAVVGGAWHITTLPQADPNGLFSPASADGTWIMMLDPTTGKASPQYVEPRIVTLTFKLPFD